MTIDTAIHREAVNTSTGNQDIVTTDYGGGTPKAVIMTNTEATVGDGTLATHALMNVAFAASSTARSSASLTQESGVNPSDVHSYCNNDRFFVRPTPGTTSNTGQADFVQFLTNGYRINVSNAPADGLLLTSYLFGGDELEVQAGLIDFTDTLNEFADVTGLGFTNPVNVVFGSQVKIFSDSDGLISWGCAWDSGAGIIHRTLNQYAKKTTSPVEMYQQLNDDAVTHNVWSGGTDTKCAIENMTTAGFRVQTSIAPPNNAKFAWLAMAFADASKVHLGTLTTPIVDGDHADTTAQFKPQFVLPVMSNVEAVNTHTSDGRAGVFAVGGFTPDAEFCQSAMSEEGATTSVCQSASAAKALNVPADDGSSLTVAALTTMDALGHTLNYSASPATAKLGWQFAIEENPDPAPTITDIDPASGKAGDTLDGVGTNLQGANESLTVGGVAAPTYNASTATDFTFDIPVGVALGAADCVITNDNGVSGAFQITVTLLVSITDIQTAPFRAGDRITLDGAGFLSAPPKATETTIQ